MLATPEGETKPQARFDVFSESARGVLNLSNEEARRFNHSYIGTEHLLLGLLRGEKLDPATVILSNLGVDLIRVRSGVEFIIGRGERTISGNIRLTPRAKKVIEYAIEEYNLDKVDELAPVHLLRGLVREGGGIAAGILESLGVRLERVREEIIRVQSEKDKELTPEEGILGRFKAIFENPAIDQTQKTELMRILNFLASPFEKESTGK